MNMTLEEVVGRRAYLKDQKARIEEELASIDDRLRSELTTGKHEAGEWTITLSPNRRLDDKRFAERFTVAAYPHYYTAKPDVAKIKQFIPPAELDQFYSRGADIVKVA